MFLNNIKTQSATDIGILLLTLLLSINKLQANCRFTCRHVWEIIHSRLNPNWTKLISSVFTDCRSQHWNKPTASPSEEHFENLVYVVG